MNTNHNTHRPDPLAHPGVIRIALSERATAALLACGECFQIVGKGSYPTDPGRMVIYCQPCTMQQATAAGQIIDGTHRAQRIRTAPSTSATPEPVNTPEARPRPSQANVAQPSRNRRPTGSPTRRPPPP